MNRNALIGGLGGVALGLAGCAGDSGMQQSLVAPQAGPYANAHDLARGADYARRDADWRFGPVVYQVLVDRFAPSADLDAKRDLYASPRRLRGWDERPTRGEYLEEARVWSHEVDFWGGDLDSLRARLDHIDAMGADVVYLNPIPDALTNHKYDATDYRIVAPEYGDRDDLRALIKDVHERDMKLMLDGVFNHTGRRSPRFIEASTDEASEYREWYTFDERQPNGYKAWYDVANLPELNVENDEVRGYLWEDEDSVMKSFLADGADGWRLDVAYDIGFEYLRQLTQEAHEFKPGSAIIGEIWSYPEDWAHSVDGLMNFHLRAIVLTLARGEIPGAHAGDMIETMVEDAGVEPILRSWLMLDNHDTQRLATMLPDTDRRRLAQVLQFTLPGAPVVYYGSELGMTGGDDPEMRGPMRWDLIEAEDPDALAELEWTRSLIDMRRSSRALRIGDYRALETQSCLAFMRRTDRYAETVIVICNASDEPVREVIAVRDSKQMGSNPLIDQLTGDEHRAFSGLLDLEVPARSVLVLKPRPIEAHRYTPHKRMQ